MLIREVETLKFLLANKFGTRESVASNVHAVARECEGGVASVDLGIVTTVDLGIATTVTTVSVGEQANKFGKRESVANHVHAVARKHEGGVGSFDLGIVTTVTTVSVGEEVWNTRECS
ncbi:hypothetical protein J6590_058097 [Homalodisca vitripennis]|nr:hypothetical protein J6590_058097 [Homalodisca vitripennis]